jgi:hypothetical protein
MFLLLLRKNLTQQHKSPAARGCNVGSREKRLEGSRSALALAASLKQAGRVILQNLFKPGTV